MWKSVESRRQGWYLAGGKMTTKVFNTEKQRVVKAVRDGEDPKAVLKSMRPEWQRLYQRLYLGCSRDFAQSTIGSLKASGPAFTVDDSWLKIVLAYLKQNSGTRIKGIEATTLQLVRNAMAAGVEAGEGTDLIAQRVADSYDRFTVFRSERIARTEVVGASNLGGRAGALSTGLKLDKTWLSTRDQRTRDDHMTADGQTRALDEPYNVAGDELMFPGDSSMGAGAENVVNCRCTETYEVRR